MISRATFKPLVALSTAVLLSVGAWASSDLIFAKADFPAALGAMAAEGKPLVLYVAHSTCPYCKRLDREVMPAVVNTQAYQQAISLQKLVWDDTTPVRWRNNEMISPDDLVARYRVIATPTILFLNAQGEEVAKRIEGYRDADFYWFYFDQSIETARQAIQAGGQ